MCGLRGGRGVEVRGDGWTCPGGHTAEKKKERKKEEGRHRERKRAQRHATDRRTVYLCIPRVGHPRAWLSTSHSHGMAWSPIFRHITSHHLTSTPTAGAAHGMAVQCLPHRAGPWGSVRSRTTLCCPPCSYTLRRIVSTRDSGQVNAWVYESRVFYAQQGVVVSWEEEDSRAGQGRAGDLGGRGWYAAARIMRRVIGGDSWAVD